MQNTLRGISGGIVLIAFAAAFFFAQWGYFLPVLFAGLAIAALIGSFSSGNPKGVYAGFQGFTWLLGLAFCFLPGVGFWSWILVVAGVSVILGVFTFPIVKGLQGMSLLRGISLENSQQSQFVPPESGKRYPGPPQGV